MRSSGGVVERRGGRGAPRCGARLRTCRGRGGRGACRHGCGVSERDRLRHGRDVDRRLPDHRRSCAAVERARRCRAADSPSNGRHPHRWSRRRIDRAARLGRSGASWPGERRRRSGAGLLRTRRNAATTVTDANLLLPAACRHASQEASSSTAMRPPAPSGRSTRRRVLRVVNAEIASGAARRLRWSAASTRATRSRRVRRCRPTTRVRARRRAWNRNGADPRSRRRSLGARSRRQQRAARPRRKPPCAAGGGW